MKHHIVVFFVCSMLQVSSQSFCIKGTVTDAETGKTLSGVEIKTITSKFCFSDKNGNYIIYENKVNTNCLTFSLLGYISCTKTIENFNRDTIYLNVKLSGKLFELPSITINAKRKVDTVFGSWKYSVSDFEFYNEHLLLLIFKKNMKEASLLVTDHSQHVLIEKELPFEAIELTKDYLGNILVIGAKENYFIRIENQTMYLQAISKKMYESNLKPLLHQQDEKIYFSNYTASYPEFSYYSYCTNDSTVKPIRKIVNEEYLHEYNMEFYFLQPKERTYVRKIAEEYNIDKHIVAATVSGLTSSIFYQALYDPLFIIKDTICVFNHCNNVLLKYNKNIKLIDSIQIDYNHPKNWREWKNKLVVDEAKENVYALYQKNGFYYLKKINIYSGKIIESFKLNYQYVSNIKIKNNYVYYVYQPFESMQEHFLYKELITN